MCLVVLLLTEASESMVGVYHSHVALGLTVGLFLLWIISCRPESDGQDEREGRSENNTQNNCL